MFKAVGRTGETRLGRLTALVGVGYFVVWTVFGMAAFPLGVALAAFETQQPALARAVPIAAGVVVVTLLWQSDVELRTVGIAMIALVVVLIVLGLPIAIALLVTGFLGLALVKHDFLIATRTLALAADGTISEYVFATVPLFVLMGLFVNVSDVGRDAFRAAQQVFGRIHGALSGRIPLQALPERPARRKGGGEGCL